MYELDPLDLRLAPGQPGLPAALVFGLGAGLYFEYWQRPHDSPSRFLVGHNRHWERDLTTRGELWRGGNHREAIVQALRANALAMNLDRAPTTGIMGMELLAEDFENWSSAPDWALCARTAGQTIARTGSFYRRHYVEFLREAAQWFEPAWQAAQTIDEIAAEWDALGAELTSIAAGDFSSASRKMRRLALREEYFWGQVLEFT